VLKMRVGPSTRHTGAEVKPPLSCCGKESRWRALVEKASNRCQVSVRKTSESEPLEEVSKGLDDVKTGDQYLPGMSKVATCLVALRHPAYRRREPNIGFNMERANCRSDVKGKPQDGVPARGKVPMRFTRAEHPVLVMKSL
jgi:hypothetical protein